MEKSYKFNRMKPAVGVMEF